MPAFPDSPSVGDKFILNNIEFEWVVSGAWKQTGVKVIPDETLPVMVPEFVITAGRRGTVPHETFLDFDNDGAYRTITFRGSPTTDPDEIYSPHPLTVAQAFEAVLQVMLGNSKALNLADDPVVSYQSAGPLFDVTPAYLEQGEMPVLLLLRSTATASDPVIQVSLGDNSGGGGTVPSDVFLGDDEFTAYVEERSATQLDYMTEFDEDLPTQQQRLVRGKIGAASATHMLNLHEDQRLAIEGVEQELEAQQISFPAIASQISVTGASLSAGIFPYVTSFASAIQLGRRIPVTTAPQGDRRVVTYRPNPNAGSPPAGLPQAFSVTPGQADLGGDPVPFPDPSHEMLGTYVWDPIASYYKRDETDDRGIYDLAGTWVYGTPPSTVIVAGPTASSPMSHWYLTIGVTNAYFAFSELVLDPLPVVGTPPEGKPPVIALEAFSDNTNAVDIPTWAGIYVWDDTDQNYRNVNGASDRKIYDRMGRWYLGDGGASSNLSGPFSNIGPLGEYDNGSTFFMRVVIPPEAIEIGLRIPTNVTLLYEDGGTPVAAPGGHDILAYDYVAESYASASNPAFTSNLHYNGTNWVFGVPNSVPGFVGGSSRHNPDGVYVLNPALTPSEVTLVRALANNADTITVTTDPVDQPIHLSMLPQPLDTTYESFSWGSDARYRNSQDSTQVIYDNGVRWVVGREIEHSTDSPKYIEPNYDGPSNADSPFGDYQPVPTPHLTFSNSSTVTGHLVDGTTARDEISGITYLMTVPEIAACDDGETDQIFFFLADGTARGSLTLTGATMTDCEAIACIGDEGVSGTIYIGAIGDNAGTRATKSFFIVDEPAVDGTALATASWTQVDWEYPALPQFSNMTNMGDAEAMFVDEDDAKIYVLTKRETRTRLYSLPIQPSYTGTQTLTYEGELSPTIALETGGPVTPAGVVGATLSPDGLHVLVKTYDKVFQYSRTDTSTGWDYLLVHAEPVEIPYVGLGNHPGAEPQGEAITFSSAATPSTAYLTVSESGTGSAVGVFPIFSHAVIAAPAAPPAVTIYDEGTLIAHDPARIVDTAGALWNGDEALDLYHEVKQPLGQHLLFSGVGSDVAGGRAWTFTHREAGAEGDGLYGDSAATPSIVWSPFEAAGGADERVLQGNDVVQTVADQGLDLVRQSNARTNLGLGDTDEVQFLGNAVTTTAHSALTVSSGKAMVYGPGLDPMDFKSMVFTQYSQGSSPLGGTGNFADLVAGDIDGHVVRAVFRTSGGIPLAIENMTSTSPFCAQVVETTIGAGSLSASDVLGSLMTVESYKLITVADEEFAGTIIGDLYVEFYTEDFDAAAAISITTIEVQLGTIVGSIELGSQFNFEGRLNAPGAFGAPAYQGLYFGGNVADISILDPAYYTWSLRAQDRALSGADATAAKYVESPNAQTLTDTPFSLVLGKDTRQGADFHVGVVGLKTGTFYTHWDIRCDGNTTFTPGRLITP